VLLLPRKPKKRLGQYFLTSAKIAEYLVKVLDIKPKEEVLEIGAGTGILTQRLCKYAKLVYAVEIDSELIPLLKENTQEYQNLIIINKDILKLNWKQYHNLKVIGNIPYYLSSKILKLLILQRTHWHSALLTLDEAIAQKLLAQPPSSKSSLIGVLLELYTEKKKIIKIPRSKFYPVPNTNSIAILFTKRAVPLFTGIDYQILEKIITLSFKYPRKTLANNLKCLVPIYQTKLSALPLLNRRAEEITIKDFYLLAQELAHYINR
jgi:16S rRNA (adenine1518-N6/adenine1519-N6)-dimethyltransferase